VSGVAGEIEEHGHRVFTEHCGVGGGHLYGGGRLFEPVVEHKARI
jgi:hypothetical protein